MHIVERTVDGGEIQKWTIYTLTNLW